MTCFAETVLIVLALAVTVIVTTTTASSSKSGTTGGNDILRTDGNVNFDVFLKQMASCGTAMSMEATIKTINGLAEDCGLKGVTSGKDKVEPYKVACGVTCVYKAMKLITSEGKFVTDDKEIKKNVGKMKLMEDEDKLKSLVKELVLCAKVAPPYSDKNCYSTIPYCLCHLFSLRRICTL